MGLSFLSFLWGNWQRVAALILLLTLVFAWAMFQHQGAELARTRAALARESALRAAAETRAAVAEAANREGNRLHQVSNDLGAALEAGRDAIHTAARSDETRAIFAAFADADRRMCDAAGGCAGNFRA